MSLRYSILSTRPDGPGWWKSDFTGFSAQLTPDLDRPNLEDPTPLRAVHTPNFPAALRQLGASLLVTTYQAGKLVMVRDEGDHLNTHFRASRPRWAWP